MVWGRHVGWLVLAGCLIHDAVYEEELRRLEGGEVVDQDRDGVPAAQDCDDGDAEVFPGAAEACNGVDDDCDLEVDEGVSQTWYLDFDGDGFGDEDLPRQACTAPQDHVAQAGDCDDGDVDTFPGALERCDGVDNDCSGAADDGPNATFYLDGDEDGFGRDGRTVDAPCAPPGYAPEGGDCDDERADIHPDAQEVCGPDDEDCDTLVDDADPSVDPAGGVVAWPDLDGDGLGAQGGLVRQVCALGEDQADNGEDCDDRDPAIGPARAWRLDQDGDGFPGSEPPVEACLPPADHVPADLPTDCDDSTALFAPNAEDLCGDLLDQDCNGQDAVCHEPFLGSHLGLSFEARLNGDNPRDNLGVSVAWLGRRADGEPWGDLILGASAYDTPDDEAGVAYIVGGPYYGSAPVSTAAVGTILGEAPGDKLGRGVAGPGDVDGDGFDDALVGARLHDASAPDAGAAYVVRGPLLGTLLASSAALKLTGAEEGDLLGEEVSAAGDVDGDGFPDLLLGAEQANPGGVDGAGVAYLVRGQRMGEQRVHEAAFWSVSGSGLDDNVGDSLSGGQDVDGDGLADVLVGGYRTDPLGRVNAGTAVLFYGPLTGDQRLSDADLVLQGDENEVRLGQGVALVPDVTGDGRPDLLLGARSDQEGGLDAGAGWVVDGLTANGTYGIQEVGIKFLGSASDRVGRALTSMPDVDGDGFPEVAFGGDESDDLVGLNQGRVYVVLGPVAAGGPLSEVADAIWRGGRASDQFGYALTAGDLDGDRRGDLVVGAYLSAEAGVGAGSVFVLYGNGDRL